MADPPTILVVDDQPPNLRLIDAILQPRGYRTRLAASGEEAIEVLHRRADRPRAPGHPDAGDGRLRGLPTDPRAPRHGVPPGRDDHGERHGGEGAGDRGRRRRLLDQAVRQGRAARSCEVARPHQALSTTPSNVRPTSWPRGTASCRPESMPRSPRSSGRRGCGGSCPRRWPSWSSTPVTNRSSRATGARSSSCSVTSASTRASRSRASPRR